MLTWLHFGDLHLTTADQENYRNLRALVTDANAHLAGMVDFAVLPVDNADDGTAAQFRLVRQAMDALAIPLHVIPGDHDFKPLSLDAYYQELRADRLPKSVLIGGCHCLFLDIVSAGGGGPDFRLGGQQTRWLADELARAETDGLPVVVFMHAYPGDLHEGAEALGALFAEHRVAFVDTGHTHYNELANDGATIYAATRSTGQIEEGPVGFSLAVLDQGVVSWRFKPLQSGWPFVMITAPADHRLITDPASPRHLVRAPFRLRAKAWSGDGITCVTYRIGEGAEQPMTVASGEAGVWLAACDPQEDGLHRLTVRALNATGRSDQDSINMLVSRSGAYAAPRRAAPGTDANAIGAWLEKGIPGTQLGPNKNGRAW